MTYQLPLKYLPAAAVVFTLAACDSSSDPVAPLTSQAVDGYIVEADVECDGVSNGITKAAGMFNCPGGTVLSQVSGGYDVGFDDTLSIAPEGTLKFTGVLKALASEPFITPMTTISVAMALDGQPADAVLDPAIYSSSKSTLAQVLGVDERLFTLNPAVDTDAAKSNAKLHQVLAAFAPSVGAYEQATAAFAHVVAESASTGRTVSLTSNVAETLTAINTRLLTTSPTLALATIDLDQVSANVVAANTSIDNAESPARVANESQKALIDQAPVTIDRSDAMVMLSNDALTTVEQLTIADFENKQQVGGMYTAKLYSGLTSVSYDNDVFQFNQNINNARVTVGFEIKSVNSGDLRSLSFVSDDVVVSAAKGASDSLVISMFADDSTFQVLGTDEAGVEVDAVIETDGETFRSDGDTLTINLERINSQLIDLGYVDILASSGDYSVTLVIDGLRVNEKRGNETVEAMEYTVNQGAASVTGNGFRGYVSVIR